MCRPLHSLSAMGFLWCVAFSTAVVAGFSSGAHAQSIPYECTLSGSPSSNLAGCPSNPNPNPDPPGYLTSTYAVKSDGSCSNAAAPYCGVKSNTPSAVAPIEAWNICRWVDNASPSAFFVPLKSSKEWTAFLNAAPHLLGGSNTINPVGCALPLGDHGAPALKNIIPTYKNGTAYFDKVTFNSNVFNTLPDFQRWHLHLSTEQMQLCNIDTSKTLQISSNIKLNHVYISSRHVIECDSVKLSRLQ